MSEQAADPWMQQIDWRSRVPRSVTDDLTPGGDEVHTSTDRRMLWHLELALTHAPVRSYLAEKGAILRAYLNETCQHHWQRYAAEGDLAAHRQCLWCNTVEMEEAAEPCMPYVNGKRFVCVKCEATVFARRGDLYTCNGCGTQYQGS
jgi:hypothetical protein